MFNPVISSTSIASAHYAVSSLCGAATPAGVHASAGLLALQRAVEDARALYADTRSHEHLVRMKDAVHALMAAEVTNGL